MMQIWPGFGEAPVPTVLSMICKPEAVVMDFPAVWAVARVGTHANDAAMAVMASSTTIEILASCRRRIAGTFQYESEVSSAVRGAFLPRRHIQMRWVANPGDFEEIAKRSSLRAK